MSESNAILFFPAGSKSAKKKVTKRTQNAEKASCSLLGTSDDTEDEYEEDDMSVSVLDSVSTKSPTLPRRKKGGKTTGEAVMIPYQFLGGPLGSLGHFLFALPPSIPSHFVHSF